MSVKQKVMEREKIPLSEVLSTPGAKRVVVQIIFFIGGMVSSHGVVFGRCAPFGVAAISAVPYRNLWATALGAIFGYLIPSSAQMPVRYIAALLAAVAIRWTLNDLIKVCRHPAFAPLVAFGPIFATGIAMIVVSGTPSGGMAIYLAESLLAAGSAYFFARTCTLAMDGRGIRALRNQDTACVALTCGVLVLSLSGVEIAGISLGRVLAVLAILLSARSGGVAGGSISGIAAGVVLSLGTVGISYFSGAYALGGK